MSVKVQPITPNLLRGRPVSAVGDSKYGRGQVVVVGGARRSPGAAMLAGRAALGAGAGRLTLAVADSVATAVAVALPECGIVPLAETHDQHVDGGSVVVAAKDLGAADAVLIGPGLDDADQAAALLRQLPTHVAPEAVVVLDAFALGVLRDEEAVFRAFVDRLILTPNASEAERLIGRETEIGVDEVAETAEHFGAVVSKLVKLAGSTVGRVGSAAIVIGISVISGSMLLAAATTTDPQLPAKLGPVETAPGAGSCSAQCRSPVPAGSAVSRSCSRGCSDASSVTEPSQGSSHSRCAVRRSRLRNSSSTPCGCAQ